MKYFNIYYRELLDDSLMLICLTSIYGTIVYHLYSLNIFGAAISLILAIITFLIIQHFRGTDNKNGAKTLLTCEKIYFKELILPALYLLALFSCIFILFANRTDESVISPWETVSPFFFIFYFAATVILVINAAGRQKFFSFLIFIHFLLSFSVALVVFKIGMGFDPFIHQAAINFIDKHGAIEPKTFYYIGQYALEIIFHKISFLPLAQIDKFLVPLCAAIFLPFILIKTLNKLFGRNSASLAAVIFIIILPFSFLTITTPQNFAYLLLILIVLLSLSCDNKYKLVYIYVLSLAAFAFHPISGIPALLFAFLITIYRSEKIKFKNILYSIIFIISASALPLAFYFIEKINLSEISPSSSPITDFLFPKIIIPGQENFILNFIYLYGFNIKIIFCLLVLGGIIIASRYREKYKIFFINFLMAASLISGFLISKILPFSFLIDYERGNYSERIMLMAAFFLLPFVILALKYLIDKTLKQEKFIKWPLLVFFAILSTTSLYFSYPRFDRYFNSHSYSVSQADIEAADWIENNSTGDYIVLANQQVSAAALREFGFKKYYKNNIFYYPIPTGGQMYQYYLDMVYKKPSKETAQKAMDLAGVHESYFVLNEYWWAFSKILEEAKLEADSWQEIQGGKIYIFKFIN